MLFRNRKNNTRSIVNKMANRYRNPDRYRKAPPPPGKSPNPTHKLMKGVDLHALSSAKHQNTEYDEQDKSQGQRKHDDEHKFHKEISSRNVVCRWNPRRVLQIHSLGRHLSGFNWVICVFHKFPNFGSFLTVY